MLRVSWEIHLNFVHELCGVFEVCWIRDLGSASLRSLGSVEFEDVDSGEGTRGIRGYDRRGGGIRGQGVRLRRVREGSAEGRVPALRVWAPSAEPVRIDLGVQRVSSG